MEFINLIFKNILSPSILFFFLGIGAGLLKSDLKVPSSISKYLSIYLMMSIGFKGGSSFIINNDLSIQILFLVIIAILFSFFIPFLAFKILDYTTNIDKPTAAALSVHYGSVSIVTFATAVSF